MDNLEITRDIGFDLVEKTIGEFIVVKRLYGLEEFIRILTGTGFSGIEYWGDWCGSTFVEASPTLIVKAKK